MTFGEVLGNLRSASSLLSFKRQLKTCLFSHRYTWHCISEPNIVDLAVFLTLGHLKKLLYITFTFRTLPFQRSPFRKL